MNGIFLKLNYTIRYIISEENGDNEIKVLTITNQGKKLQTI